MKSAKDIARRSGGCKKQSRQSIVDLNVISIVWIGKVFVLFLFGNLHLEFYQTSIKSFCFRKQKVILWSSASVSFHAVVERPAEFQFYFNPKFLYGSFLTSSTDQSNVQTSGEGTQYGQMQMGNTKRQMQKNMRIPTEI